MAGTRWSPGPSGIGEAVVREFAPAGVFVWIADINLAAAESLACSVGAARALHLDVTSPPSVAAAVARLERLDILVNNAGIGHVAPSKQPNWKTSTVFSTSMCARSIW
jgi:NAD(P)-dependent dehydrogenase (short-subunit alcohol dehydrogenase family)